MASKSKKANAKPKKSTSTLPQVNWPIVFKSLLAIGTVLLIWMAGSWAMKNLVPAPKLVYKCSAPDNGYETIFCGKHLMAMKSIENRGLIKVKTSKPSSYDRKTGVVQTVVDTVKKDRALPIHESMIEKVLERGPRQRVLILGLGGGALPLLISDRCPDCEIVAVDLFEDALTIVRQFVLADDGHRIQYIQRDASKYVTEAATESFDVIMVDICQGAYMPEFLFGVDFIGQIKRLMRDDAICLSNVYAPEGASDRFLRMFMTLRQVFPSVDVSSPPNIKTSFLLTSSKIEPPTPESGADDGDLSDAHDHDLDHDHDHDHDHNHNHDHDHNNDDDRNPDHDHFHNHEHGPSDDQPNDHEL